MKQADIFEKVRIELRELSKNPENIKDYSKFYKDGKPHIGISTPLIRKVSSGIFREAKSLEKKQILSLCERLLKTKGSGCGEIAFDWAFRIRKQYRKEDFEIFESWIKNYVDSWSACDDLCARALGEFICRFPEVLPRIRKWMESPDMWFRRASAVALIYSLRRGKYLKEAFDTAEILFSDREDLVQKGCGWMLNPKVAVDCNFRPKGAALFRR